MVVKNGALPAIVFSGGAAYASFEVGVMRALIEGGSPATNYEPLVPRIYTGTSGGAINAAVLASEPNPHVAIENLQNAWLQLSSTPRNSGNGVFRIRLNPFQFIDPRVYIQNPAAPFIDFAEDVAFLLPDFANRGVNFLTSKEDLRQRLLELFDFASFVSTTKLQELLPRFVRSDVIRESNVALRIIATNWNTGKASIFENKDFAGRVGISIVLRSAAIPGVFPLGQIQGVPHVDGTVVENTPLLPAIKLGSDVLHIMEPPDAAAFLPSQVPSSAESFYRTVVISLATLLERDIERAAHRNRDVEILEGLSKADSDSLPGVNPEDVSRALFREATGTVGRVYRKLTIHRYKAVHQFGYVGGLLDFRRREIERMIEAGYQVGMNHDCGENGCVIPDREPTETIQPNEMQMARSTFNSSG